MKIFSPEISWHNREPVLSVDIQTIDKNNMRLVTSGSDCHLIVWRFTYEPQCYSKFKIQALADLGLHQKAVNVVKFSPQPGLFASGDDDGNIFLWKLNQSSVDEEKNKDFNDSFENIESWMRLKTLYGHREDVVDICWSPDGRYLLSGSIDNEAIIWDCIQYNKVAFLTGHNGYVQGVAWDPFDQYLVTLSTDRNLRVFNCASKQIISRIYKANVKVDGQVKLTRLFYDDTLRTFSRRICFSPGGEVLIAPSGIVELPEESEDENFKFINAAYLFMRNSLNKPMAYFSTGNKYNIAVKFCPIRFKIRENLPNHFPFPYRLVFAVATQDSILFYDTQQLMPFAMVSDIHYTRLTDLAWSSDGNILMVSSTDGFCTFVIFSPEEFGDIYEGEVFTFQEKSNPKSSQSMSEVCKKMEICNDQSPEQIKIKNTPESAKITSFFQKMDRPVSQFTTPKTCKRKECIDLTNSPIRKHHKSSTMMKKKFESELLNPIVLVNRIKLEENFDKVRIDEELEEKMNDKRNDKKNIVQPLEKDENKEKTNTGMNGNASFKEVPKFSKDQKTPRRIAFITLTAPKREYIDKVPKINSPVLVIHGTEDEVIDISHGLAIYERCPRAVEPLWVEGAGHNDVELHSQYLERLKRFVEVDLVP